MIKKISKKRTEQITQRLEYILSAVNGTLIDFGNPISFADFGKEPLFFDDQGPVKNYKGYKFFIYKANFYAGGSKTWTLYINLTDTSDINSAIAESFCYFQIYNVKFPTKVMLKMYRRIFEK